MKLITGASGFIGSRIAAFFKPEELFTLGRTSVEPFTHIKADLRESIEAIPNNVKTVIHVAGLAHVKNDGPKTHRRMFQTNAKGTQHLLAALPDSLETFILISTVAVYGQVKGSNLDETTECRPTTAYAMSKFQAEEACRNYFQAKETKLIILRLPLVIGANAPGNFGSMVAALKRHRYLGVGSGQSQRSMVWVDDVAKLVHSLTGTEGVFNLTDDDHLSFLQLETVICQALNRNRPLRLPLFIAKGLGLLGDGIGHLLKTVFPINSHLIEKMTSNLTFDNDKAKKAFDWSPTPAQHVVPEVVKSWKF